MHPSIAARLYCSATCKPVISSGRNDKSSPLAGIFWNRRKSSRISLNFVKSITSDMCNNSKRCFNDKSLKLTPPLNKYLREDFKKKKENLMTFIIAKTQFQAKNSE